MKVKKFLKNLKSTLGLNFSKKDIKENSMKDLLKKLAKKNKKINKKLQKDLSSRERGELLEEQEIIKMQIQKTDKILKKLNS